MENFGGINNLATIVGTYGINAAKTVIDTANNTSLLQQFSQNQVLRGFVHHRSANNIVSINTEQGTLHIQTDIFLKRGAEVALKIESKMGQNIARLITIDGMSVAKYMEQMQGQPAALTQDEITSTPNFLRPAVAGAPQLSTGDASVLAVLRGVFLTPPVIDNIRLAQMPPVLQQAFTQAGTGTSLQVNIISVMMPNPNGDGFIPLTTPMTAMMEEPAPSALQSFKQLNSLGYLNPSQRLAADINVQAALQNQQAAKVGLNDIMPPSDALKATAPTPNHGAIPTPAPPSHPALTPLQGLPPNTTYQQALPSASSITASQSQGNVNTGNILTDSVAGAGQNNLGDKILPAFSPKEFPARFTATVIPGTNPRELVLQSEFGSFKLFVNSPLPKGTVLIFDIQQAAHVRGSIESAVTGEPAPLRPEFEGIKQITELKHTELPLQSSISSHLVPHIIPRAGANLSTEMLFLFAALQGGDLRKWLGDDNIRHLESLERQELLTQLGREFSSMKAPPAADNRDGNWYQLTIPLWAEEHITPIQYFFKRSRHNGHDGQFKDTDHFMVDIELTRMGRMQLDGLVQKHSPHYQFDLIIRTEQAWGQSIEQDIRLIYQRAQEISGFTGMMMFQHGKDALLPLPVDNMVFDASNSHSIIV